MKHLFLSFSLAIATLAQAGDRPPNIVFIFADDQCHDTIGALGGTELKTPHLDKLVSQGTSFTNTYNMGAWNGAVCVASRTMLISGRSLWRAEALDNDEAAQGLAAQGKTWPQLLKKAGYETYFSGKWHTKIPLRKVFDHVNHPRPGMPNQTPAGYKRPLTDGTDTWDPTDPQFNGFWKGGKHWSEILADDAEAYFQAATKSEKPFFFFLSFNAPHDPRQAPQEYLDLYPAEDIAIPKNYLPLYPHMDAMGLMHKNGAPHILRDEDLAPLPRSEHAIQVHRREYYALISHLDTQVGRIMKALEDSGQRENTIIIYSADHGLACGQHGLLGKQNMYEHSLKPPLIIVGEGIPANERREAMVYLQDILPTTLDLAGAETPDFVEFNSLLPLAKKKTGATGMPAALGSYTNTQRMIRVGDEKLIVYAESKTLRLFNLAEDPHEMNDLAGDPSQQERVKELFGELTALLKAHEDPLDLSEVLPQ